MERERSEEPITSQDIIFEILLRLPTRSLTRFKTTCKQWYSIISDDLTFEELHRRTQIQKLRLFFQTSPSKKIGEFPPKSNQNFWICKLQDDKTKMEKLQRFQFRDVDGFPYPVDSSGALLLSTFADTNHMVPKTLVYDCNNDNQMVLPCLPSNVKAIWKEFLVYDSSTNIYKVLAYTSDLNNVVLTDSCYITSFNMKTKATENGWRMMPLPSENFYLTLSKIAIRSLLYWLLYVPKDGNAASIQLFDIAEEKFLNTIKCPDKMLTSRCYPYEYHLMEFKGSLGLTLTSDSEFKIWVLKDSTNNSWIELHKIHLQSIFDNSFFFRSRILHPVFILENLNALPSILFNFEDKYYWYEMIGEKMKEMDVLQLPANGCCLGAWFF